MVEHGVYTVSAPPRLYKV